MLKILLVIILWCYTIGANEECLDPSPKLLYSENIFSKDNSFIGEVKIYDNEDPTLVLYMFLTPLEMYSVELVEFVCLHNNLNCKPPIIYVFHVTDNINGGVLGHALIRKGEEPADVIYRYCLKNNILESASYLTHITCNNFQNNLLCNRLKALLFSREVEIKIYEDVTKHYKASLDIFENESPLDKISSFTHQHNLGYEFAQLFLSDFICQDPIFLNYQDCDFDHHYGLTTSSLKNRFPVFIVYCKDLVDGNIQNLFDELFETFQDVRIIDCYSILNSKANAFKNPPKIMDLGLIMDLEINNSVISQGHIFAKAIGNISSSSIMFINGDVKSGFTNWEEVLFNLIEAVDVYDIGLYSLKNCNNASVKNYSKGRIVKSSLEIIDRLEGISCLFISRAVVSYMKSKSTKLLSKLDFGGISELLMHYASFLGGYGVVYDSGISTSSSVLDDGSHPFFKSSNINHQRDLLLAYSLMTNSEILSRQWSLFPNIHFASFGDSVKYKNSIIRISKEAEEMKVFHSIEVYHEHSNVELESFFRIHQEFVSKNKRGFGYWIWKPFIALLAFKSMRYNDILVYADSGCSLNKEGIPRLHEYVNYARVNDLVGFQMELLESGYSKGDLLDKLNCTFDKCMHSGQVMATMFVVRKSKRMEKFLYTWLDMSTSSNYQYLSDQPSIIPNMPNFIEHRHDQSIFSILIKTMLHNRVTLLRDEGYVYADFGGYFYHNKAAPIIISHKRE